MQQHLLKNEAKECIRVFIMAAVSQMNDNFFRQVNLSQPDEQDFFIRCMDAVFDSDSYKELRNKLEFLVDASNSGNQTSNEVIESLEIDTFSEVLCGEKIKYPKATEVQNMVEKPKTIIERMIALYNTKFTFDTTEVCLVKYWNSCDLIELCSDIQWAIEEEIKNNSSSSNPAKRKTISSR